jgi:hypothetical protein
MAGLVPAIHVLLAAFKKDVDARHKAGHDAAEFDANRLEKVLAAGQALGPRFRGDERIIQSETGRRSE